VLAYNERAESSVPEGEDLSFDSAESIAYNTAAVNLRREIATLQDLAYGPSDPPANDDSPLHDPSLDAQSFIIRLHGRLVSYAGVVTKTIQYDGQSFTISGLSCVATDPGFQRRGLASLVVAAATSYMAGNGVDVGVFTCAPELVQLYSAAGAWMVAPDVLLVGSRDTDALTSASLGVVVLMRLFSAKTQAAATALLHGTIDLDLPLGQFW